MRLENLADSDVDAEWPRLDARAAVEGTGVGPENFVWPPAEDPDRVPYRGWEPFEDIDAGVFFGRDAAILRGLDELRTLRRSGPESMFVVLGPSGSGKSSYLRAGLIPRLQREARRFTVLGTMRPERHAINGDRGFLGVVASARRRLELSDEVGDLTQLYEMLSEIRSAAARQAKVKQGESAPTLVLAIDQAEELFSADAEQAEEFLASIADLTCRLSADDIGLIVLATIRTDRYEPMQDHPALEGVGTVLFNALKPMPSTEFDQVITGPASRDDTGPGLDAELVDGRFGAGR